MKGIDREQLNMLAQWIKSSNNVVVFTGAGMSTESGIPDFRSKTGIWKTYDPSKLATIEAIEHNYTQFHEFYEKRLDTLEECKPHEGHYIIAEWEKEGYVSAVVTQNVDGFHKLAGSENVCCLHGDINTFRCHQCGKLVTKQSFFQRERCKSCNSRQLRPNIVLFGEGLSRETLIKAEEAIINADLLLVIGTSLLVSPANQLPALTKGKTVYINNEYDDVHIRFDLVIEGQAGQVLKQVNEQLQNVIVE